MGLLNLSTEVAPSTPSANTSLIYTDSTSKNLCEKNDAGTVNHMAQTFAVDGTLSSYPDGLNDDGSWTRSNFGAFQWDFMMVHGADIAAASTLNLGSSTGYLVDVTGNTNITAITLANGLFRVVRFTGTPTITNGASLVLPGAGNITAVAGDMAIFVGYAAGIVRCVSYSTKTVQGTGASVKATSPTLTTPVIGVATGTSLAVTGALTSSSGGAAGVGYATGAGGTVTQATNKSTGVTLSKMSGQITMNNAALLTITTVGFTLTNTSIAATDIVIVNIVSGATLNSYYVFVDAVAAGSCHISLRNDSIGTLSEAVVIGFVVIKGVTA